MPNKEIDIDLPDNYFEPLDEEEAKIMQDIENGLYVKGKKMLYLGLDDETYSQIKQKAKEVGIPYQALINSILHRYISGGITINNSF